MLRKLCLPGRERRTNPVYCAVSNRMVPGVHVDASADSASAPYTEGASVPKQAVLPRDAGYNAGNSVLYGPDVHSGGTPDGLDRFAGYVLRVSAGHCVDVFAPGYTGKELVYQEAS